MQREARYGGAEGDENQSQAHANQNHYDDSAFVEDIPDTTYWWRGGIVPASLHVVKLVKENIRRNKATSPALLKGLWSLLEDWFALCLATEKPGETVLFQCPKGHTDSTVCPRCDRVVGCKCRLTEFPHAYKDRPNYFQQHIIQRIMRQVYLPQVRK